jgi:fructose-bisphosphate aldolase/2-amino-3,7-dideoxy-D-threo-hept-6-ulosonate synthase
MTSLGKQLRLARIIDPASQTAVIVPIDHPVEDANLTELNDPVSVVAKLAPVGPDAFLMRRGAARVAAAEYAGRCGWAQRLTGRTGLSASGIAHGDTRQLVLASVEDAVRNGADAVVPTFFFGPETEDSALPELGRISDECSRFSMPLIAELFPGGGPDAVAYDGPYTIDEMRLAVRIASEEGADLIKTYYPGDPDAFRKIIEYSFVPVVIAGGPNVGGSMGTLKMVREARTAGAAGVAFGRRVWGCENPTGMLRAIIRILREDVSVEEAAKELA